MEEREQKRFLLQQVETPASPICILLQKRESARFYVGPRQSRDIPFAQQYPGCDAL